MKTKTELDQAFEYRDDPAFSKHVYQMLASAFILTSGSIVGLVVCVCNADAIDRFFSSLLKSIML